MERLNDRAIVYHILNSEKTVPYSCLGKNYSATYTPSKGIKKMQYQEPSCGLYSDSIDEAIYWSYGSGTLSQNELTGGKYLQFFPLD